MSRILERAKRLARPQHDSFGKRFLTWVLSSKRNVKKLGVGALAAALAIAIMPGIVYAAVWRLTHDEDALAAAAARQAALDAAVATTEDPTVGGLAGYAWPESAPEDPAATTTPERGLNYEAGTVPGPSSLGPSSPNVLADDAAVTSDAPETADTKAEDEPTEDVAEAAGKSQAELVEEGVGMEASAEVVATAEAFVMLLLNREHDDAQRVEYLSAITTTTGAAQVRAVDRATLPDSATSSSSLTSMVGPDATVDVALATGPTITVDLNSAGHDAWWLVDGFEIKD